MFSVLLYYFNIRSNSFGLILFYLVFHLLNDITFNQCPNFMHKLSKCLRKHDK
jgi:hypothetical protein